MTKGGRNRLITWAGFGIPYRPEKTDLLETTAPRGARARRRLGHRDRGGGEDPPRRARADLRLADGTAYFALRSGVPIIPLAINGT